MKKGPFVSRQKWIGYQRALIVSAHDLRSIDLVERYVAKICHMGTNNGSTTISIPPTLRTMFLFKGAGGDFRVLP
jgi:hypothetical protein